MENETGLFRIVDLDGKNQESPLNDVIRIGKDGTPVFVGPVCVICGVKCKCYNYIHIHFARRENKKNFEINISLL